MLLLADSHNPCTCSVELRQLLSKVPTDERQTAPSLSPLTVHGTFEAAGLGLVQQLVSSLDISGTTKLLQLFAPRSTAPVDDGFTLLRQLEVGLVVGGRNRLLELYSVIKGNVPRLQQLLGEYLCDNSIDFSNWLY